MTFSDFLGAGALIFIWHFAKYLSIILNGLILYKAARAGKGVKNGSGDSEN